MTVTDHCKSGRVWRFIGRKFTISQIRWAYTLSLVVLVLLASPQCVAQSSDMAQKTTNTSIPMAIVSLNAKNPDAAAKVTGALEVSQGRAIISTNGSVTAGSEATEVILPHRGTLRVCASTTVKLAADSTVPANEVPGLMMAIGHGAIEASFATGRNSDVLLTPDFRILIGGPGSVEVKVRLGQNGDTCIDNPGAKAPYVLVTSVIDGSVYRVQPGQRVMLQHGNLREVVDQEKESCGCPATTKQGNEFPEAQSAGMAPQNPPTIGVGGKGGEPSRVEGSLAYNGKDPAAETAATAGSATNPSTENDPAKAAVRHPDSNKKRGFFHRVGRFFRHIFGAE
jgi:hypothetical protein